MSTRRDAHGLAATLDEAYVHSADRIQNTIDVFDTATLTFTSYDLTSADGQGNGPGACALCSIADDGGLPTNDPAGNLMYPTPDGKYLLIALRGPVPVSVDHSSQGSCPGVGVIELTDGGASGYLVDVLRATNTTDTSSGSAPGGHPYQGAERSDVHGVSVVRKQHRATAASPASRGWCSGTRGHGGCRQAAGPNDLAAPAHPCATRHQDILSNGRSASSACSPSTSRPVLIAAARYGSLPARATASLGHFLAYGQTVPSVASEARTRQLIGV